jgi:hypothetical protein
LGSFVSSHAAAARTIPEADPSPTGCDFTKQKQSDRSEHVKRTGYTRVGIEAPKDLPIGVDDGPT